MSNTITSSSVLVSCCGTSTTEIKNKCSCLISSQTENSRMQEICVAEVVNPRKTIDNKLPIFKVILLFPSAIFAGSQASVVG